MKTQGHISLAHLHLLLPKYNTLLVFSTSLKTSSFFCRPALTRNIIIRCLLICLVWSVGKHCSLLSDWTNLLENYFLLCWPGLLEKLSLICRPGSDNSIT